MVTTNPYREVAEAAWVWVLDHVREVEGPWLPESVTDGWEDAGPAVDRDSLYAGIAGLAPVLAEIAESRPLTDAERRLAKRIVERLSAMAATRTEASLYDGLAGDATALRMLAPVHVPVVLHRLAELMTPDGWATTLVEDAPEQFDRRGHGHRRGGDGGDLGGRRRGGVHRAHRVRSVAPGGGPHRGGAGLGVEARSALTSTELLARHGRHR